MRLILPFARLLHCGSLLRFTRSGFTVYVAVTFALLRLRCVVGWRLLRLRFTVYGYVYLHVVTFGSAVGLRLRLLPVCVCYVVTRCSVTLIYGYVAFTLLRCTICTFTRLVGYGLPVTVCRTRLHVTVTVYFWLRVVRYRLRLRLRGYRWLVTFTVDAHGWLRTFYGLIGLRLRLYTTVG